MLHGLFGGRLASALGRERGALPRPLEALIAGARPDDGIPTHVGDRDDRIIEGSLNVSDPALNQFPFLLLALLHAHVSLLSAYFLCRRRRRFSRLPNGRSLALSRSGVRFRALSPNRQTFAMAQPAVCSDIDEPFDVQRDFFAQIPLDLMVAVDNFTQLHNLVLAKVFHANRALDPGFLQNVRRRGTADPENIRQPDVHPLLSR